MKKHFCNLFKETNSKIEKTVFWTTVFVSMTKTHIIAWCIFCSAYLGGNTIRQSV
jgi:hypothetical protein